MRKVSTLSISAKHAVETLQKIKDRLLSQQYTPMLLVDRNTNTVIFDGVSNTITDENVDEIALFITKQIVQDTIYNDYAKKVTANYVDEILDDVLNNNAAHYPNSDKPLQRLSVQTGDDRHAFMLLGAPACGKGTMCAALEVQAKEGLDIDWNDTIRINTDDHRDIVSDVAGMGEDITVMSNLNVIEAAMVSEIANKRVLEQLDRNEGHHLVIDGVYPSSTRFKMAKHGHSNVHVVAVSVPVDTSVTRSYVRGFKEQRFVGTEYLIGAHQALSRDLLKNMVKNCSDAQAEMALYDTDVPYGTQPKAVISLDMETKTAVIHNLDGMAKIYGKKNININATSAAELFDAHTAINDYGFVSELETLGMTVSFRESDAEAKLLHEQRKAAAPTPKVLHTKYPAVEPVLKTDVVISQANFKAALQDMRNEAAHDVLEVIKIAHDDEKLAARAPLLTP